MATFTSHPITVSLDRPPGPFTRADLEFHGVNHARASFEARLFLDHPDAGLDTPTDEEHGYAGSFFVFGHGGCAGDDGHCDVPSEPPRPFDLRPEHQLTPVTERVLVTDALRRLTDTVTKLQVSVVPVVDQEDADDLPEALLTDLLHFERVNLVTYQ